MIRRGARRGFDLAEATLARLTPALPRLALAGAFQLGWLRNRLSGRWPEPAQLSALFSNLGPAGARHSAWQIGGFEACNRIIAAGLRLHGLEWLRPLVRTVPEGLSPPNVLGLFHVGAFQALGPALSRLPGPVLGFRDGPLFAPGPALAIETTAGDAQQRAASFARALAHLEHGGAVALALDVVPGPGLVTRCLGRPLELARGPFALARLAQAPLVPLCGRFRGGGIEVVAGPPLAPLAAGLPEQALADAAARWLEEYLSAAPSELGLGLLRRLLAATGSS